jgi:cell division protein FtsN
MINTRRRQRDEGRLGSILAAIGCLGLLAFTFGAGFYSGRILGRPASAAPAVLADAEPAERPGPPRLVQTARPSLTFYEELTAPLPPPMPTAPKVAEARRVPEKTDAAPAPRAEDKAGRAEDKTRSDGRASEAPARSGLPAPAPRFTVQIAAYSARASAEALRNTITAAGHQAYIVENDGPPGTPRYRVRVGSYPTREAAIAAASRLPGAGARYVTSR